MTSAEPFDILIIGGGASGMMAAVCAGRFFAQKNRTARIAILEKHAKIGRKLAATGNGHCNLSNQEATSGKAAHYHSEDPLLYENVLDRFPPEDTIRFFQSIGILCHIKEKGKVYPFCEQAYSVIHAFAEEISSLHIEILLNMEVREIAKTAGGSQTGQGKEDSGQYFKITGIKDAPGTEPFGLLTRKVIVATGGKASPALSSNGLGYNLLKSLSHTCTRLSPAIVQLRTDMDFIAPLAGTKWNAGISLMRIGHEKKEKSDEEEKIPPDENRQSRQEIDEKKNTREIIRKESGELLFTKYGISGPPILQLSGHLAEWTENGNETEYYAVIDFLEEFAIRELIELLSNRIREFGTRPIHEFLVGVLPYKIAATLIKRLFPCRENQPVSTLTQQDLAILVSHLKNFPLKIVGTTGWEEAQVTAGGIRCRELNPKTLESKFWDGLYITGEVLDVDGDCGGFNLQFAWASGCIAGESAAAALLAGE